MHYLWTRRSNNNNPPVLKLRWHRNDCFWNVWLNLSSLYLSLNKALTSSSNLYQLTSYCDPFVYLFIYFNFLVFFFGYFWVILQRVVFVSFENMSYAQIYKKEWLPLANSGVYTEPPLPQPANNVCKTRYW